MRVKIALIVSGVVLAAVGVSMVFLAGGKDRFSGIWRNRGKPTDVIRVEQKGGRVYNYDL